MMQHGDDECRLYVERLGLRLKSLRDWRHMTQEDVATAAMMPRTQIGQIERGQRAPSIVSLNHLAIALDLEGGHLLLPRSVGRHRHGGIQ